MGHVFSTSRRTAADRCEHCGDVVERVWLVPGDVLDSCAACFRAVTGRPPVHAHGHTTEAPVRPPGRPAAFHQRVDGRRPAGLGA